MQNYLLVYILNSRKLYIDIHIKEFLSAYIFTDVRPPHLAGDVLCRILGVVGVMGKQCYFQYIKILVS